MIVGIVVYLAVMLFIGIPYMVNYRKNSSDGDSMKPIYYVIIVLAFPLVLVAGIITGIIAVCVMIFDRITSKRI